MSLLALCAVLLSGTGAAQAFPRFARAEGKPCGYCHINPGGGGKRNYRGLFYKKNNFTFAGFDDAAEANAAGVEIGPEPLPPPKSQTGGAAKPTGPKLSDTDRTRLSEAFVLADGVCDQVWPGWGQTPFAVLLVTPDTEFLIRHPKPTADFTKLGYDDQLKGDVYYRKRTLDTNLLATYPAVRGVSTVVIGQAENTAAKTSTAWVVTLLHEHFHQFQDTAYGMADRVKGLGLAKGDETGMWMLNYAFPYDDPKVGASFAALSRPLGAAIAAKNSAERATNMAAFRKAEGLFVKGLKPDDARYYQFQIWKEGVARYVEYRVASAAAKSYKPSAAFTALPDAQSFQKVADSLRSDMTAALAAPALSTNKRVSFYSIGFGEALLLDSVARGWQSRYFDNPTMDPLWKTK